MSVGSLQNFCIGWGNFDPASRREESRVQALLYVSDEQRRSWAKEPQPKGKAQLRANSSSLLLDVPIQVRHRRRSSNLPQIWAFQCLNFEGSQR